MRSTSVPLSIGLHGAAVAALMFGLWPHSGPDEIYIPPIPIEVISQAELADEISIPEMTKAEEPVEEEPAAEEPEPEPEPVEPEPEPEPAPVEPEPEPEPAPAEPEPEPEPAPVEEEPEPQPEPEPVEEEPAPEPEPEPVEEEDDLFADLNDSLVDLDPDKQRDRPSVINPDAASGDRDQERVGAGDKLSVTEEALLASCVRQNYRLDRSARDWESFAVMVRVKLNIDGTLSGPVEILNERDINRSGSAAYQAAARNAVAAISGCFPLDGLDPARYNSWKQFTYNFRPQDF